MSNDASVQNVIQNLKDAGCDTGTIEEFLVLDGEGKTREQLKLLARHRQQLLDRVHREEKRIDCLDYLVYQLNKNGNRRCKLPIQAKEEKNERHEKQNL